jgi:ankyrin repeat protein
MQADSTNILELLIKYGANIELKDKLEGDNALLLAATKCSKKKVELLLKLGMDINEINQLSQTPLIKAISNEYTKENKKLNFIKMLLENKADVNLRDENNKTAFIISKEKGYKNISKLLLQYGAKEESYVPNSQSLINALINKEYNRAKEMINSDIELNFVGTGDFSPLMCSIENIEVMKLLLEKGADVNLKNKMNMTALTMAVISNKQDAVKLLLENKADIHLKNYRGVTVLDVAKKTKNNPEMIKLLKDYGAKE